MSVVGDTETKQGWKMYENAPRIRIQLQWNPSGESVSHETSVCDI